MIKSTDVNKYWELFEAQFAIYFEALFAYGLISSLPISYDDLKKFCNKLNNQNENIISFRKIFEKCLKDESVFKLSKRELYNAIIAGKYDNSEDTSLYTVLFNINKQFIQELSDP